MEAILANQNFLLALSTVPTDFIQDVDVAPGPVSLLHNLISRLELFFFLRKMVSEKRDACHECHISPS